jgi:hypothetical protein
VREEEEKEEGAKCTSSSLYKGFETDPSCLTLVIYKSTVVFIKSLKLALATNTLLDKYVLFRPLIGTLCQKAPKV